MSIRMEEIIVYLMIVIIVVLIVSFYYLFNILEPSTEKECYEYYKENNYILEECKKYKEKFKKNN